MSYFNLKFRMDFLGHVKNVIIYILFFIMYKINYQSLCMQSYCFGRRNFSLFEKTFNLFSSLSINDTVNWKRFSKKFRNTNEFNLWWVLKERYESNVSVTEDGRKRLRHDASFNLILSSGSKQTFSPLSEKFQASHRCESSYYSRKRERKRERDRALKSTAVDNSPPLL